MGQKLCSKLLFTSSPNSDGFYRFIFYKVVYRGVEVFSNHFITNFPLIVPVKNYENRSTSVLYCICTDM